MSDVLLCFTVSYNTLQMLQPDIKKMYAADFKGNNYRPPLKLLLIYDLIASYHLFISQVIKSVWGLFI